MLMAADPTAQDNEPAPLSAEEYERLADEAAEAAAHAHYVLCLYVAGTGPLSIQAVENVNAVCAEHLAGRFELKVVDIHQLPGAVQGAQIVAAPTLVRSLPLPVRRLIGNLASRDRVLRGLDVVLKPKPTPVIA